MPGSGFEMQFQYPIRRDLITVVRPLKLDESASGSRPVLK